MLKGHNLRLTQQRKVILEALHSTHTHPGADEIYQIVRQILPRISLGTVYRNLEILSEMGEIQKLEISGGLKRFDGNPHNHYHIRCKRCDRIDDAPLDLLQDLEQELEDETGFDILGHRLEFVGFCAQCLKKTPVPESPNPLRV